jgi:hypothetical protein
MAARAGMQLNGEVLRKFAHLRVLISPPERLKVNSDVSKLAPA